ncbi:chromatin regulatory protein sir2, putative [Schistosoma mansoni]|uniref:chromatin regulatory protein sir2, putative n=1 Tax=Schistosoma mansoni TaxID=6183 RepID=UPI0001A641A3|nr:chromatin regulatory protein sir2, putative [Schistosoma mansoni]|eukprot:XP_018644198.1 chromatin regulatory protein sir2, putative [Schistosoma mansoni]
MDTKKEPSISIDNSEIVVLSSDDENDSQNSHDNISNEKLSSSVISIEDDDDNNTNNDESAESDCEILNVEDLQGEEKWRDIHGPFKRLNRLIQAGFNDPRLLLVRVFGMDENSLPSDPNQLLSLLLTLLAEPAPRRRLRRINSLEKVLSLLSTCTSILVITGAGISVSCGIPDFRSRDGIYARLSRDYPDLSSPQAMFDMSYFKRNPIPFFKFAKELFPGQFSPSITHRMIALLESKDKLLRNYTQNIDTLEQAAGITRLIQCHGSFASATCTNCKLKVSSDFIKEAIFTQSIPRCTNSSYGVLKPDIVFFGEGLSNEFHDSLSNDIKQTDLVLVIGSSLKVRPVSHIPNAVPRQVPQILINREPLSNHDFDVELLGDCDVIVSELCHRLGWEVSGLSDYTPLTEIPLNSLKNTTEPLKADEKSPNVSHLIVQDTVSSELVNDESQRNDNSEVNEKTYTSTVVSSSDNSSELMNKNSSNDAVIEVSEDEEDGECVWEVASSLPPGTFTRIYPNQYVFPGAEIYLESKPGEVTISCNASDISITSNASSSSSASSTSGHNDDLDQLRDSLKDESVSIDITEKEESSIHSSDSRKSLKRHNSNENLSLNKQSSLKQPRSM